MSIGQLKKILFDTQNQYRKCTKWLSAMQKKKEAGTISELEDHKYGSMCESLSGLRKDLFRLQTEIREKTGYDFIRIGLSPSDISSLKKDGKLTISLYTAGLIEAMEKDLDNRKFSYGECQNELAKLKEKMETMTEEEEVEIFTIETGMSYDARNAIRLENEIEYAKAHTIIEFTDWGLQEILLL